MSPDEQTELLKEIRDILLEQSKLVDAQWADYRQRWDDQIKENKRNTRGCLTAIISLGIIILIAVVSSALSK